MEQVIVLLQNYGYFAMLPLAVIEGPILSVIGGFFVTLGIFNPFAVYVIVVVGDIIGDSICYVAGRFGGAPFIRAWGPRFGATPERVAVIGARFSDKPIQTVVASKLIHGIGFTGLVTAGIVHVPYLRFISTCAVITLGQAAFFLVIGLLFGQAYKAIGAALDYGAAIGVAAVFLVVLIYGVRRYWK